MIASQAMIPATFSCVKQSMALGCFPRLKIIHTSTRQMGQIYIPVINWFLMIMCFVVVAIFRSNTDIANAYEILPPLKRNPSFVPDREHSAGDARNVVDMANQLAPRPVLPPRVRIGGARIPLRGPLEDQRGRLGTARVRLVIPLHHVHVELRQRPKVQERGPRDDLLGLHARAGPRARDRAGPGHQVALQRARPRHPLHLRAVLTEPPRDPLHPSCSYASSTSWCQLFRKRRGSFSEGSAPKTTTSSRTLLFRKEDHGQICH